MSTSGQLPGTTRGKRLLATSTAALRPAAPAILGFLAVQTLGLVLLVLLAARNDVSPAEIVGHWDGQWFLHVARNWYDQPLLFDEQGAPREIDIAFFPGYPALVAALLPFGLSPLWAALVVTVAGGVAAAWGLFELGRRLHGPRVGTVLAVLWGAAPGASVLHMAYSESVFVALAVWTLVALLDRAWLLAAGLTVPAGLTRVTAWALVAAVVLAAVTAGVRRQDGAKPWLAVVVAPLGLVGWLAFVAVRTGRLDGWYWLEDRAWQVRFDWGAFTWDRTVLGLGSVTDSWLTLTALVVLASVVLLLWSWTERMPLFLHLYGALVFATALGSSNFFQSRARFLLPAVTLVVPLAVLLARLPTRALVLLLSAVALAGGWYGAFLMTAAGLNP